jgi:hypothetical protein
LFGALAVLVAAYLAYKAHPAWPWLLAAAAFFAGSGLVAVPVLRPVYTVWMKFAHALAWVNTRLLLGVFFYVVMTPVGLLMRLFGKDMLEERLDPSATSYWKKREPKPFTPSDYERLF